VAARGGPLEQEFLLTGLVRRGAPPAANREWSRRSTASLRRTAYVLLPLAGLGLVAGLDALPEPDNAPLLLWGLLDEPAHFVTVWLFLAAFVPDRYRTFRRWALVGSVAIDVDHVPLYLWHALAAGHGSRPVTHSLSTVLVLALAAAVASRRLRPSLLGVALGTLLHFFRDFAEGPGVPLLWPADATNVVLPHGGYLLILAAVTLAATARRAASAQWPGTPTAWRHTPLGPPERADETARRASA
jgi:inner membrane protein